MYSANYYSSPTPEDIGYRNYGDAKEMETRVKSQDYYLSLLRNQFGDELRGRKVLDVGCGFGYLLHRMKDAGWHVEGVEVSAFAAQQAKQLFDIDVVQGYGLQSLKGDKNRFDVVTFLDVLEHFADPKRELAKAHELLKHKGLCVLRIPVHAKGTRPILKADHLYYFTEDALLSLLRTTGFHINAVLPDPWRGCGGREEQRIVVARKGD